MKTQQIVLVDWNSIDSIKKAEKKKTSLENKGYSLKSQTATRMIYEII